MERFQEITHRFLPGHDLLGCREFGSGHINDTYLLSVPAGEFVLQRINHHVFRTPDVLMDNMTRVCRHLRDKLERDGAPDPERRCLELVTTSCGESFCVDSRGNYWRLTRRVRGVRSYDRIETSHQAYQVGQSYGRFQRDLCDLPGPRLAETIPDFHNTPRRLAALEDAIAADPLGRVASAQAEITFARARASMVDRLVTLQRLGLIPERITHNDTKLNNILLDEETDEALCVVDLDTVMPGLSLYDFGDMVRSGTCMAPEDETELDRVQVDLTMFAALTEGYLDAVGDILSPAEVENLAFSGRLITFELGLRFLTDYLTGDHYFKTHREGHNLDRVRSQFALVRSMEERAEDMEQVVGRCVPAKRSPMPA